MKIFKYVLCDLYRITEHVSLDIPRMMKILSVGLQDSNICIWAIVDEKSPMAQRHFRIYGTGHPLDAAEAVVHDDDRVSDFVGRIDDPRGLVWHIFLR